MSSDSLEEYLEYERALGAYQGDMNSSQRELESFERHEREANNVSAIEDLSLGLLENEPFPEEMESILLRLEEYRQSTEARNAAET